MAIQNALGKDSEKTAQAGLNLRWAHVSEDTFPDVAAHRQTAKVLKSLQVHKTCSKSSRFLFGFSRARNEQAFDCISVKILDAHVFANGLCKYEEDKRVRSMQQEF